jgi:Skp family chaperone for outer membrane proteins
MKIKHVAAMTLLVAIAASITLLSPASSPAQAQPGQPAGLKIATANPSKVFFNMKEKADVQARLADEHKKLQDEERSRRQKVEDLRSALELIKPDAPQYEQANRDFTQAAIEFKNWGELSQAQSARNDKRQTKMLFDKIMAAISDLAKQRGFDLVIAEQPPINIEKTTAEMLPQLLLQREVLYSAATMDITNDVVTKLDEQYNASKK